MGSTIQLGLMLVEVPHGDLVLSCWATSSICQERQSNNMHVISGLVVPHTCHISSNFCGENLFTHKRMGHAKPTDHAQAWLLFCSQEEMHRGSTSLEVETRDLATLGPRKSVPSMCNVRRRMCRLGGRQN